MLASKILANHLFGVFAFRFNRLTIVNKGVEANVELQINAFNG